MKKGEVTVYLSLVFVLLMTFVGGIIESASIQISKNYKRGDMDRAIESVFAEYQIKLLKEYEIFALEGTYETAEFSEDYLLDRIIYYGGGEAQRKISGMRLLTDDNASAFQEQIMAYMEHKLGLTELNRLTEDADRWTWQSKQSEDYQMEEAVVEDEIKSLLSETDESLPEENNPLVNIANLKQSNLLHIVVPNPEQISKKQIDLSDVPSGRVLQKGHGSLEIKVTDGALAKAAVGEYILEQFDNFLDAPDASPMSYQIEYILGGKSSDAENLKDVVNRLIMLRFVPNYAHLLSDPQKKAEASAAALSICALLSVPGIAEVVKHAFLLAWAYGESIMDIRSLLAGKKVALVKSAESWQLSLSGLLSLGTEDDRKEGADVEGGMDYRDHLRILLLISEQDTLAMRGLDMVEQNLRGGQGLSFFRADYCISAVEINSNYALRRGLQYQFYTRFGYQ